MMFQHYEPYVPRYYLGLALRNLGDCQGARENWQQSEPDGAVKQTNLYSTLASERAKCSAQQVGNRAESWWNPVLIAGRSHIMR